MATQIIDGWIVDPTTDRIITKNYELSADENKANIYFYFSGISTILRIIDKEKKLDLTYTLDSKIPPGTGVKFLEGELKSY